MLQQTERVDPGFIWQAMATIALRNYWFYLRVVLDYRWMDPWLHGEEVCRFLDYCEDNQKDCLVLMPRGTGKTGLITQPRPAWWLARKPHSRVLLANAEEKKAAKMARSSANIMAHNAIYKNCFPDVIMSPKWGEDGYYLAGALDEGDMLSIGVERVDPSLGSYGIRGNVTGAHVNGGMVLDDLINKEMAKHPNEVKKAGEFFGEAINCIDPGTPLVVCATRWTYHDYCGDIERGELRGRRGRLEVLKLGATRKNKKTGKEEILFPLQTWEDNNGIEHEVGMTFENLQDFKVNLKGQFPALYYNEPVLEEDCLFDLRQIKRYKKRGDLGFDLGGIGRVVIECESQASALISTIGVMMRNENRSIPIESVKSKRSSKKERILTTLQHLVAHGKFNMREESWQGPLGEEMKTFDKGYDDCFPADTPIITKDGIKPICEVTTADEVLTRVGYRKVLKSWSHGRKTVVTRFGITATPEHRIWTENRGWVSLDALSYFDTILVCERQSSSTTGVITDTPKPNNVTTDVIIPVTILRKRLRECYIEIFGSTTTGKSQQGSTFTTRTATRSIMTLRIWFALALKNIGSYTKKMLHGEGAPSDPCDTWRKFAPCQPLGTDHLKDVNGTESMPKKQSPVAISLKRLVQNVRGCLSLGCRTANTAETLVEKKLLDGEPTATVEVFDLMVEGQHEFFAHNVLVHNCLDAHTYCALACHDCKHGEIPTVNIAVDPAFTEEDYSDYTAIAVGCMYDGEYYELDTIRFQTNRSELLVRYIFNVYDNFDNLAFDSTTPPKKRMGGFSSYRARARTPRIQRGGMYNDTHTFDIDLRGFIDRNGGK